ncbi:MAG TPA: UTRA domain-containing protein, partial [Pararhizobium sp.]|nr:UTRA domain-containing protein [Pararhizobium sp.]
WGITIAQSEERLKAIPASVRDARHLSCRPGEPLLLISRLARDLEGRPVELRWSRCLTRDIHYAVRLR